MYATVTVNPPDKDMSGGGNPYSITEVIFNGRPYHNVVIVTCISQNVYPFLEAFIYRRLDCAIRLLDT